MSAVTVNKLIKRYTSGKEIIEAVKGISFDVKRGELFGLVGPDGAGKTSLFRMLTTLLLPDGGSAVVDGSDIVKDYKKIRSKVGYMPGRFSLYPDLSVEENLEFFATIFNSSIIRNYDLVKNIYVQLEPFKKRKAGKLSGGMKQKLALCCALIHRPVVLFLDEPTTGVDAVSRKEFWEMLQGLREQGITILVSTPYMDEAALCNRVLLLQNGETLAIGTPHEITASFPGTIVAVKSEKMFPLLNDLKAWAEAENSYAFGEYHHLVIKDVFSEEALKMFLNSRGHLKPELHKIEPNIEDCFMHLMKA